MRGRVKGMATASAVAALYVILALIPGFNLIAYGPVQFRVSEVLMVLSVFSPWTVAGLTIGCFIANMLSPIGVVDVFFGTAASFLAGVTTYFFRKKSKWLLPLPSIVFNGLIVGWMLTYFYINAGEKFAFAFLYNAVTVAVGEAGVCYVLGLPFLACLEKRRNYLDL